MTCIKLDNGDLCKEQKTIIKEQERFYQNLYPNIKFTLKNNTGICLNEVQQEMLKAELNIEEFYTTLKLMKKDKVAGLDGLNKEFYEAFWMELKYDFWNMVQYVFERGQLSTLGRTSVISLLPKRNKDP